MNYTTENSYVPFETYSDLLTVEEIQIALGIGRSAAYHLIHSGDIKYIKIGRSIRIPKRYLIDYVYGECYNINIASGLARIKEA